MTDNNDVQTARPQSGLSRRTVMKGAAWSAPLVAAAMAAPISAASDNNLPKAFSSWGRTSGSINCRNCNGSSGKYTWNIDNTSGSGLSYHGMLWPNATATLLNQTLTNIVNIYWLPFNSGTVTSTGTGAGWSTLAYDSTLGTVTGPDSVTYYPWVTTYAGPITVTAGMIDNNDVFKLPSDYKFTVSNPNCLTLGALWVSHAYTYSLNGTQMTNPSPCTSYNGNYCGGTANYPSTSNGNTHWRNNGWVGKLANAC